MTFPLEHPEAAATFNALLLGLGNESHRGAVLVGQAIVENCLADMLAAAFPPSITKDIRTHFFKYPGPLSSFAAKVHMAHALRLIPPYLAGAMHALRRMRNDVAHSPDSFSLVGLEHRYHEIFELGPNVPAGVRRWALEMMMDYKMAVISDVIARHRNEYPEHTLGLETRAELAQFILDKPEILKAFNEQLPQWELAIGLAIVCSMLIMYRDDLREGLKAEDTLPRILKERSKQTRWSPESHQ